MSRIFHFIALCLLASCVLMTVAYPILMGIEGLSFGARLFGPGYVAVLATLALLALVALKTSNLLDSDPS